jgi:hypothetical protein
MKKVYFHSTFYSGCHETGHFENGRHKTDRHKTRGMRTGCQVASCGVQTKKSYFHITLIGICAVLFAGAFLAPMPAYAQFDYGFEFSKAGSSGLQFLKIPAGAREAALGEAGTAISNDINAIFWNPSGLAFLEKPQFMVSHNQWLVNSTHNAAAVAFPLRGIVVGLSVISLSVPSFEETTVFEPDGTGRMVDAGDVVFGLAVARRFTRQLVIGGQVKYAHETLDDYNHGNFLFDIGAGYDTGFRDLRLGFSLQHFGPDMQIADQTFRTPLIFRIGASDMLYSSQNFGILASAELVHPTDNVEWVNTGIELSLLSALKLRGGYRFNSDISDFTGGFGLVAGHSSIGTIRIDYAYIPSVTVFKSVHQFSVSFSL